MQSIYHYYYYEYYHHLSPISLKWPLQLAMEGRQVTRQTHWEFASYLVLVNTTRPIGTWDQEALSLNTLDRFITDHECLLNSQYPLEQTR